MTLINHENDYGKKTNLLFSVHTLELRRQITRETYQNLRDFYAKDAGINKYGFYPDKSKDNWIVEKFAESNGLIIKLRRNAKGHSVILRINPRNWYGEAEYMEIYNPEKTSAPEFTLELSTLLLEAHLGDLEEYVIKRLDLCVNLELESQEMVDSYMTLIARSRDPYPLTKAFYYKDGKRDRHGVYFNGKDYGLYVYEKAHQLRQNLRNRVTDEELERKLIRFEIRLERYKIRQLEKTYGSAKKGWHLFYLLGIIKHISEEYFCRFVPRLFLMGAYYHLDEAHELVDKSGFYDSTKEDMKMLLHETSRRQGLENALHELHIRQRWESGRINVLLNNFNKIAVNPVCLPQRCSFSMLPSLPDLMGMKKIQE